MNGQVSFRKTLETKEQHNRRYATYFFLLIVIISALFLYSEANPVDTVTTTTIPLTTITIPGNQQAIMQEFLQENLLKDYLPASLDVELLYNEQPTTYKASWISGDTKFYTALLYNGGKEPDIAVSVTQPRVDINKETFLSLFDFFPGIKLIADNWKCTVLDGVDLCYAFWLDGTDKKSVGIFNIDDIDEITFYQMCEIPAGSKNYDDNNCITLRVEI